MGRCKRTNEEMPGDDCPLTSHSHRVNVGSDNLERQLLCHSVPYGVPGGERGLMFCSYCGTPVHFENHAPDDRGDEADDRQGLAEERRRRAGLGQERSTRWPQARRLRGTPR